ncbi:MAG: lactate utilization protein [Clostridia bacterium]
MDRNVPFYQRCDRLGPLVAEALKRRHFEAYYCAEREEALEKALELIPKHDLVSWGGSISIEQIGLKARIKADGYRYLDRDEAKSPDERMERMRQALLCDTYLTSSNAITRDGQLFNIDGNGNRVAAMSYGPRSVIVVAGINKVVSGIEAAMDRVRNYVAPINVNRFPDSKTPCLETGMCSDCIAAKCACTYMVTTRLCKPAGRIKVILLGDELGL